MSEKLCIFCNHFHWRAEEQCGMGSTMTGPMMTGGDASCRKGHLSIEALNPKTKRGKYINHEFISNRPENEDDFRRIILIAAKCPDYDQVEV